ncbi:MAG: Holliday junction resolvase RuvX [Bacteroidetes bacterium]|nr:Holliday junction resolvase RuvX [Bacteroidota bacterium]
MGRIIAIDYGTKRTGLAVTDETQTFAFGLTTLATHELSNYLRTYVAEHVIEGFVIGEPKTMANGPTNATVHVELFVKQLGKIFPGLPLYRMDERFTSKMASQSIIDSGIKKMGRRNKSMVDMVSATIILQSWIEKKNFK